MRNRKPRWQIILNLIVWVTVIGLIDILKRIIRVIVNGLTKIFKRIIRRKKGQIHPRIVNRKKLTNASNNTAQAWWSLYWSFFAIIFFVISIGLILYLPSQYGINTSDKLISSGSFAANITNKETINGTYIVQNSDKSNTNIPSGNEFDLAIVSGILGGFALTVMFAGKTFPSYLKSSLLLQGIFYAIATIAFIIFGFYFGADKSGLLKNITGAIPIYTASFYIGLLSLSFGISLTLWSLIRLLFSNGWRRLWGIVKNAISGT
jgi:hypothetical protein